MCQKISGYASATRPRVGPKTSANPKLTGAGKGGFTILKHTTHMALTLPFQPVIMIMQIIRKRENKNGDRKFPQNAD